jgi:hypothetical protein
MQGCQRHRLSFREVLNLSGLFVLFYIFFLLSHFLPPEGAEGLLFVVARLHSPEALRDVALWLLGDASTRGGAVAEDADGW